MLYSTLKLLVFLPAPPSQFWLSCCQLMGTRWREKQWTRWWPPATREATRPSTWTLCSPGIHSAPSESLRSGSNGTQTSPLSQSEISLPPLPAPPVSFPSPSSLGSLNLLPLSLSLPLLISSSTHPHMYSILSLHSSSVLSFSISFLPYVYCIRDTCTCTSSWCGRYAIMVLYVCVCNSGGFWYRERVASL